MDATRHEILRGVDTPTVCNAVEVAQGRRGFDRFTRGTPVASSPGARAMVGRARTARIRAAAPADAAPEVIRARRMDYYRYMAEAEHPAVAVIEDADGRSLPAAPGRAAPSCTCTCTCSTSTGRCTSWASTSCPASCSTPTVTVPSPSRRRCLATAIARLIETERLIIEPARRFEFEAFEAAWCALEEART